MSRYFWWFLTPLPLSQTHKSWTPLKVCHTSEQKVNPLTPIGSPVTHENWPMNWPNFAVSPALLGWPARNRHTAACIHRFSHILRWPPELVVWFMSESRAVANEHEGHKRTLPIISSSFEWLSASKGYTMQFSTRCITLWRRLGRRWPTRIWIDPISPRRRRFSAGLHATDTLRHAYIDFLTYSDDHPSR